MAFLWQDTKNPYRNSPTWKKKKNLSWYNWVLGVNRLLRSVFCWASQRMLVGATFDETPKIDSTSFIFIQPPILVSSTTWNIQHSWVFGKIFTGNRKPCFFYRFLPWNLGLSVVICPILCKKNGLPQPAQAAAPAAPWPRRHRIWMIYWYTELIWINMIWTIYGHEFCFFYWIILSMDICILYIYIYTYM